MPPDARLGDAPHLQALREPTPALRLVPRHILQQVAPVRLAARLRASAGLGGGAVLVHLALGAAFFFLLSFRDAEVPREVEIPVEVVAEAPKREQTKPEQAKPEASGTGAKAEAGPTSGPPGSAPSRSGAGRGDVSQSGGGIDTGRPDPGKGAPAKPDAAKPDAAKPETAVSAATVPPPSIAKAGPPASASDQAGLSAGAIGAPAPAPQSEPASRAAPAARPASASPQPAGEPAAPKLVAPPPEAARAATRAKENRPANLVPDHDQIDQATREARPTPVPTALTTPDAKAQTSVPMPAKARSDPADRPTPPTVAKTPSQADKLAAVLPMDTGALPSPFRSVLAGNAAAQINAAYGGVVQGRIRQASAELAGAASARHFAGAVAVTFTLDDAGGLAHLSIVQSSGNAELDAMVTSAIERIAPFPAPPPEAEHTFQKAFLVGGG